MFLPEVSANLSDSKSTEIRNKNTMNEINLYVIHFNSPSLHTIACSKVLCILFTMLMHEEEMMMDVPCDCILQRLHGGVLSRTLGCKDQIMLHTCFVSP